MLRADLFSHGLAPSGNYDILSSIKVHSGAVNVQVRRKLSVHKANVGV